MHTCWRARQSSVATRVNSPAASQVCKRLAKHRVCPTTHSSHAAIRLYGRAYVATAEKKAYFTAPVVIGDYSFVGAHATILPGTRIGKGSIVTAYSMVKGEYPDFAILSGNPAVAIGDTRSADAKLLKSHPELRAHYEAWAGADTPPLQRGSH